MAVPQLSQRASAYDRRPARRSSEARAKRQKLMRSPPQARQTFQELFVLGMCPPPISPIVARPGRPFNPPNGGRELQQRANGSPVVGGRGEVALHDFTRVAVGLDPAVREPERLGARLADE